MNRREFVKKSIGVGVLATIPMITPSLAHNEIKVDVADLVKVEIPDSVYIVFYIEGRYNDKNQKGLCMKQHDTEIDTQIYNYDSANIKLIYKNGVEEYPILGTKCIVYPGILRPTDNIIQNRLKSHSWYFNQSPNYECHDSNSYLSRIHLEWNRCDLSVQKPELIDKMRKETFYIDLCIDLQTPTKYKIDSNDYQCRRFGMDFCSSGK